MKPGKNYYGMRQMFKSKCTTVIFQAKNLSDPNECEQLFSEIEICNYYYIFRLSSKKKCRRFRLFLTYKMNLKKERPK